MNTHYELEKRTKNCMDKEQSLVNAILNVSFMTKNI